MNTQSVKTNNTKAVKPVWKQGYLFEQRSFEQENFLDGLTWIEMLEVEAAKERATAEDLTGLAKVSALECDRSIF